MALNTTKLQLSVDGTLLPVPDSYDVSSYRLTKSGRVANGDMTAEIIAKKRKLFLTYETLGSEDATLLENKVAGDKFFFTINYTEDGMEKTMVAYAGEFKKTLVRTGGRWYWKDVSVNLIEK